MEKHHRFSCRRARCLLLLLMSVFLSANVMAEPTSCQSDLSYGGVALLPFHYLEWPSPGSEVAGLRLGIIASRHPSVYGLDVSPLVNYTDTEFYGVGISTVNSHGEARGLQAGLVNAAGLGYGVQIGFWNMVEDCKGLQIGVMNFAHRLCGVQIGLGNIIAESSFSTCIIMNACF